MLCPSCSLTKEFDSLTSAAGMQMGGEFAVSSEEQRRQLEALKTLDVALGSASLDAGPSEFAGLSIRLYHPDSCPFDTFAYVDESGTCSTRGGLMEVNFFKF